MKMIKPRMSKGVAVAALMSVCVAAWGFNASAAFTNLCLHKTVVASSSEDAVNLGGDKITDGDTVTRWGSAFSDSQWVYVDFGAVTTFDSIEIWWEHSAALSYNVQTSNTATANDQGWTTIAAITNEVSTIPDDHHTSIHRHIKLTTPSNARYLKVRCLTRNFQWGSSMYELQAFNTQGTVTPPTRTNVALNKPAVGSSVEGTLTANLANNGDTAIGSRWGSNYGSDPKPDSAWWYVDLGAVYTIDSISIQWEHSGAKLFWLQTLKTGVTAPTGNDDAWTTFHIDSTTYDAARDRCYDSIKVQPTVDTRYLRVRCVKRIFTFGFGIIEFRAFGVPAGTQISHSYTKNCTTSSFVFITSKAGVTINFGKTSATTADIFSTSGQLIRRLSGSKTCFWNYKDAFGRSVTNGTYLIKMTSAGKTIQDKITVNR